MAPRVHLASSSSRSGEERECDNSNGGRRETRPTLAPASFSGEAAAAYREAREVPEVLDQLTCYCACRNQYGHVSLLSCYTDGHGAT